MVDSKKQIDQWGPIDAKILYTGFWFLPTAGLTGRDWKTYWPEIVGVYDNSRLAFYWEARDMQKKGEKAIDIWILSDKGWAILWGEYRRRLHALQRLMRRISQITTRTGEEEAKRRAQQLYNYLIQFWSLTCTFELANFAAPLYLERLIQPHVPAKDRSHVLEVLLAPTRLSFHQRSELDMLRAVAHNSKDKRQKALRKVAQKWHWVENSYFESKKLSVSDFRKQAFGLSQKEIKDKIIQIQNYPSRMRSRKYRIAKKYRLPKQVMSTAHKLSFSIWWQDHRKAIAWWANAYIDVLSGYASKRFGMPFDDLMYYMAEEWRDLFVTREPVSQKEIARRKRFAVVHMHDSVCDIYTGARARTIAFPFQSILHSMGHDIIAGTPVSKGKGVVRGRVHVLVSARTVGNMKKGEILVAPMTSPDYIVAMRKASAIITDVGGLMSHAAVVSRELGVPCIVGTRVATKKLKTGDRVEVDAEQGVVRKI